MHVFKTLTLFVQVSELPSTDPRWIGCWWLGFIIIAAVQVVCIFPMLCFPRQMTSTQKKETFNTVANQNEFTSSRRDVITSSNLISTLALQNYFKLI